MKIISDLNSLKGREIKGFTLVELIIVITILAILATMVLALGVYPQPLTDMTNATVTQLLSQFTQSKLPVGLGL